MAITSTTRQEMPIDSEDDVILVRKAVRALAQSHGFDTFATAALTTATSELTRNVWVHAGKGVAILEELTDDERRGVRVTFVDEGPGIADIPRVMAGGYSTARSMGMGLSGSPSPRRPLRPAVDRRPRHDGGDREVEVDLDDALDLRITWLGEVRHSGHRRSVRGPRAGARPGRSGAHRPGRSPDRIHRERRERARAEPAHARAIGGRRRPGRSAWPRSAVSRSSLRTGARESRTWRERSRAGLPGPGSLGIGLAAGPRGWPTRWTSTCVSGKARASGRASSTRPAPRRPRVGSSGARSPVNALQRRRRGLRTWAAMRCCSA